MLLQTREDFLKYMFTILLSKSTFISYGFTFFSFIYCFLFTSLLHAIASHNTHTKPEQKHALSLKV